MNYHQARQIDPKADRPDAGKWRYTNMNDGRVWPEGYCAQGCPGHDTPEEAEAHQREYELDHARFEGLSEPWGDCEVPGCTSGRTPHFARVGPGIPTHVQLCAEHLNRDGLALAFTEVGQVISS